MNSSESRRSPVSISATFGASYCDFQGCQESTPLRHTCNISWQPCINNKAHNATCERPVSTTRAFNRCDARLHISILFNKERVFTADSRLKASPDHSFMRPLTQNSLGSRELMIIGRMGVDGVFGGTDVGVNIFGGMPRGHGGLWSTLRWPDEVVIRMSMCMCKLVHDLNSPWFVPPTERECVR